MPWIESVILCEVKEFSTRTEVEGLITYVSVDRWCFHRWYRRMDSLQFPKSI